MSLPGLRRTPDSTDCYVQRYDLLHMYPKSQRIVYTNMRYRGSNMQLACIYFNVMRG